MMDDRNESTSEKVPTEGGGRRSSARLMVVLLALSIGMFVFAYANAEFFVMICQKAGLIAQDPSKSAVVIGDRPIGHQIEVYFSAHVEKTLPMVFSVDRAYQKTNINKATVNDYFFQNMSDQTIYFRPVHDVSPMRASQPDTMLLEQCFCFSEQKIGPGERYSMPVKYTFTEKLADSTRVIKMNYTLFPSTKENYEASLAAIEAGRNPHDEAKQEAQP